MKFTDVISHKHLPVKVFNDKNAEAQRELMDSVGHQQLTCSKYQKVIPGNFITAAIQPRTLQDPNTQKVQKNASY